MPPLCERVREILKGFDDVVEVCPEVVVTWVPVKKVEVEVAVAEVVVEVEAWVSECEVEGVVYV